MATVGVKGLKCSYLPIVIYLIDALVDVCELHAARLDGRHFQLVAMLRHHVAFTVTEMTDMALEKLTECQSHMLHLASRRGL